MKNVPEYFGCDVFSTSVMKERLPKETFEEFQRTLETGHRLDITVAKVIADAMKDWAIEKGATHYTHWFQPLTGITAEKHDSFITPTKFRPLSALTAARHSTKRLPYFVQWKQSTSRP